MKKISIAFSVVLSVLLLSCAAAFAAGSTSLHTSPDHITIGTTYDGTTLDLSGTVPEGCTAVIRITGEHKDTRFKEKGKALGLLWMNLGTVELRDIPELFLIGTDTATYASGGPKWKKLGLGFDSVKGETDDLVFNEFIKLVSQEELYEIQEGVVTYSEAGKGLRNYSARMALPSSLKKGAYDVEVAAVRDGRVVERTSRTITADLAGFPALLSSIAFGHELVYGISAVVIAILAGLLMTLIFRDRGGVH
ncbi:TIGR02186 family protein [Maridesulfovibrio sp.]|uniref:TIGR02186 family protein n=1 Tax=Maridesulfovibrio sp. TaxID=2795000 RepID=UPI002A18ABA6|nr:TIGR02186 family protein [Maridesulfovibrio sp.]